MRKSTTRAVLVYGVGATILAGCGGSSSSQSYPSSAGTPSTGNYRGTFQYSTTGANTSSGVHPATTTTSGTILINVPTSGPITVGVGLTGIQGIFTGGAAVSATDAFSATLNNTLNGQIATVGGTAFSNSFEVSLSGSVVVSGINVAYVGAGNPLAGTYTGAISGGSVGLNQSLTFKVGAAATGNVTGNATTTAYGIGNLSGSLSPVGVFYASVPLPSTNESINLTGSIYISGTGQAVGSGTWTDSENLGDQGVWSVTGT